MRGRKRPQSERIQAVSLAVLDGPAAAARQTGIPENTIREWVDRPEFVELRERTKEAVADEWWAIVQKGMRRVADLLGSAEDLQKVAVATAIVTDKMLLLRGEATMRTESTLLRGRSDHEQRALADLINRELERLAYPDASGHQAADPVEESASAVTDPA